MLFVAGETEGGVSNAAEVAMDEIEDWERAVRAMDEDDSEEKIGVVSCKIPGQIHLGDITMT